MRVPCVVLACGAGLLVGVATAQPAPDALATIAGGADPSGQQFEWVVTNHHVSPLVEITFPHYRADTFTAPQGWETDCTNLVNVGVADEPGTCTARAHDPQRAIQPLRQGTFSMRLARGGAPRGKARVQVRFADGQTATIAGVELPVPPSSFQRFAPVAGLGAILALVVATQVWRRARRAARRGFEPT